MIFGRVYIKQKRQNATESKVVVTVNLRYMISRKAVVKGSACGNVITNGEYCKKNVARKSWQ